MQKSRQERHILLENKIKKKTIKHTIAENGCKPIITPNEVATPFPPLNPAKLGKDVQ